MPCVKKTVAQHVCESERFVCFLLFVQLVAVASRAYTPVLVNDVADDERRQEEQAVAGYGALRLDVDLVDGDDLALGRGRLSNHLQASSQSVSCSFIMSTFLKRTGIFVCVCVPKRQNVEKMHPKKPERGDLMFMTI